MGITSFAEPSALGDPDGDGYVTSADARIALRIAASLEEIDADSACSADVSGDAKVTAADARRILRMSAMLEESSVPVRTSLDYDRSNSSTKLNLSFGGLCNPGFYVTISAENVAGLQNANLFLEYDADLIEFKNIQRCNDLSYDIYVGDCISEGKISLAWTCLESTENNSEDIAVIEFAVKKDGNANFTCNVGTWDGTDAPADVNIQQAVAVDGEHVNTTAYEEYFENSSEFEPCVKTYYSAGVYCNDCQKWISGHESSKVTEHLDLVEMEESFEYIEGSCIMTGYTAGVYCEACNCWISGHNQTMQNVHVDNNSDKVCDYCNAYFGIPNSPDLNNGNNDKPTEPVAPEFMLGDVSGDEKVTAADARIVLRASAKLEKLEGDYEKAADVNKDGKVHAADARFILRVSAKLETLSV